MTELEKAARQALEALVEDRAWLESDAPQAVWDKNNQANTALRRALSDSVQERSSIEQPAIKQGWDVDTLLDKPKQPAQQEPNELTIWKARALQAEAVIEKFMGQPAQQEPVAWMDGYRNIYSLEEKAAGCEDAVIPLYTRPQAREWVGLTDVERAGIQYEAHKRKLTPLEFMELHEAKLREKNA